VAKNTASGVGFKSSTNQSVGSISSELSKIYAGRTANTPVLDICVPGSADETVNPDGSTTTTFIGCNFLGLGLVLDGTVIAFITTTADTITTDLEYTNFTITVGFAPPTSPRPKPVVIFPMSLASMGVFISFPTRLLREMRLAVISYRQLSSTRITAASPS
jgi:hypothetical protein